VDDMSILGTNTNVMWNVSTKYIKALQNTKYTDHNNIFLFSIHSAISHITSSKAIETLTK
jgi:hypothetical protein